MPPAAQQALTRLQLLPRDTPICGFTREMHDSAHITFPRWQDNRCSNANVRSVVEGYYSQYVKWCHPRTNTAADAQQRDRGTHQLYGSCPTNDEEINFSLAACALHNFNRRIRAQCMDTCLRACGCCPLIASIEASLCGGMRDNMEAT
mmetsp:Transcript_16181/g.44839  ORF Transcript_16181/g.44839 Transcript_16181/m.44839 type:complete len:148 (+) Transcript_16181:1420-1863(+)